VKATPDIRILIVEDDPFFQRVLLKRLAAEGYQVEAAADGREGMKAIVTFEPDLVISDWMMPHVDGLELCQSVKTGLREASPYFILLTAKGEISDKLLALDTGADDYLVKPCDQGELLARIRAGLRIVLLTQDLRKNARELEHVRQELKRLKLELMRRGLATPEEPGAGEKAA
jgi:DNA-binding response OmpR family regulator